MAGRATVHDSGGQLLSLTGLKPRRATVSVPEGHHRESHGGVPSDATLHGAGGEVPRCLTDGAHPTMVDLG